MNYFRHSMSFNLEETIFFHEVERFPSTFKLRETALGTKRSRNNMVMGEAKRRKTCFDEKVGIGSRWQVCSF